VEVVQTAHARLASARLLAGVEPVQIGVNSQRPRAGGSTVLDENARGAVDHEVRVLRLEREDGAPVAVAFNHATHPECLGGENLLITADFPGHAVSEVRRSLGDGAVPLFLQGCAGNITPRNACQATFDNCEHLGTQLGQAIVRAWHKAIPLRGCITLRAERKLLRLPLLDPPSPEDALSTLEKELEELDKRRAQPTNRGWIMLQEAVVEWATRVFVFAR